MSTTNSLGNRYAMLAQEDRSAPRRRVSIPDSLRASGSKGVQTAVNDLSLSGFSATSINRIHPGTIVWLTMPGMESMQASVVWWEDGLVGCAFEQLLSPIIHDNIL
ncbi:MAG: PilZ domain-containing protein, partial [Alphaproteobacteria bacterium]|nr:PilZ domain-containing protein [Alphaproteobacteria bacterium]